MCFRWGGEEFLILLPGSRIGYACPLAERLRQSIADATLPRVGQVTMAFGVGQGEADKSIGELLSRVDRTR